MIKVRPGIHTAYKGPIALPLTTSELYPQPTEPGFDCTRLSHTAGPTPTSGPAKWGSNIRAVAFFMWSLTLALPLFVTMLCMSPLVLAFDKYK